MTTASADDVASARRTVLLVEDEPTLNEVVCGLLAEAGYHALCVPTLAAAYRELDRCKVDCVLLDLTLPDGSGEELLAALADKADSPAVVVYSGSPLEGDVAKRYGVAMVGKPFDIDVLLATISVAIDRQTSPSLLRQPR